MTDTYTIPPLTVLCKWHGQLVLASVAVLSNGEAGRCPTCGSTEFRLRDGWLECDCGFAYLKSHVDRARLVASLTPDSRIERIVEMVKAYMREGDDIDGESVLRIAEGRDDD